MITKQFFMNPGPTPVPDRVLLASQQSLFSHRSRQFSTLLQGITDRLQRVFQTEHDIIILTTSGTGAMEASLANLFTTEDKILGVSIGSFGDRFIEIARRLHLPIEVLCYTEGEAADPHEIIDRIQKETPPFSGLILTHHETTTGVVNDLETISALLHQLKSPPLLVVDAISSLGAVDVKTSQWGLDVVITSSQKALMTPPGLSILSISPRALHNMKENPSPPFYLDLKKAWASARKGETPYTPAISLFLALQEALAMMEEEGLENIFKRHLRLRDALRDGIRALGLKPFVRDEIASPAVTTILSPEGLEVKRLRSTLARDYGVIVAGGKKELKDKIFRIGHLGYFSPLDIIATLSALEMTLLQLGVEIEAGCGVAAAEKHFCKEVSRE